MSSGVGNCSSQLGSRWRSTDTPSSPLDPRLRTGSLRSTASWVTVPLPSAVASMPWRKAPSLLPPSRAGNVTPGTPRCHSSCSRPSVGDAGSAKSTISESASIVTPFAVSTTPGANPKPRRHEPSAHSAACDRGGAEDTTE